MPLKKLLLSIQNVSIFAIKAKLQKICMPNSEEKKLAIDTCQKVKVKGVKIGTRCIISNLRETQFFRGKPVSLMIESEKHYLVKYYSHREMSLMKSLNLILSSG